MTNQKYKDYIAWALMLALFIFILAAGGCNTLKSYEGVDTTRKGILVANAELKSATLLLDDLVTRQVVGRTDATNALNHFQDAHDQLQAAKDAVVLSGDPFSGTDKVEQARTAIRLALTLLAPYVEDTT